MARRDPRRIERVRESLVLALRDADDTTEALIEEVSWTIASGIEQLGPAAGPLGDSIVDFVLDTLKAVDEVRGDPGAAAKGAMAGVVRGTADAGEERLRSITRTAATLIRTASRHATDLGAVTRGLIEGAVEGAEEIGADAAEAASAVADGALEAARAIGAKARYQVRGGLSRTRAAIEA